MNDVADESVAYTIGGESNHPAPMKRDLVKTYRQYLVAQGVVFGAEESWRDSVCATPGESL